jgi:hypothetical protein
MDVKSIAGVEEYRLLLFQPDPETGERICVGVAVDRDLIYARDLPRVQCFTQKTNPDILRVYLKDIRDRVARSEAENLDRVIRDFAPMFMLSAPRNIVSPVTQSAKLMLLRRFVGDGPRRQSERMRTRREYFGRLIEFARTAHIGPDSQIIENARPADILGMRPLGVGRVNRVALAIRRPERTVLMDGLDLNRVRANDLLRACGQVVHTFWQYGRASKPYGERLSRIAIIFNGSVRDSAQARDAHDFAVSQFQKESDETIEATSPVAVERLSQLLA